ncbi:hypothetical protein [Rhodococcoides corynebacterioides]|uniref:hypothetical protein n=1 Tax=Rhodococcoides corynebacterioides TaxID=53972 RepID=UPI001C9A47F4|nr:hypothetical protein [Rhodococcus corynebacterioides]MBY6350872.1 hypothetical protein [Rhodococcus corynebacterioides]
MTNHVKVSREDALQCALACDRFGAEVEKLLNGVAAQGRISGFGTLPSGVALNEKYTELTSGGSGSLTSTLQCHIDVATKLADTFRRMGEQYVETDDAVAASLQQSDTGGR